MAGRGSLAGLLAYGNANVKIVGTHAGVGIGPDGYSQMGLEDLALMRTLPGMQVFQPGDERETQQVVAYLAAHEGPAYLRLTRQDLPSVHGPDYRFEPGKIDVLAEGKDVAILATGGTVGPALEARARLGVEGVDAAVINVHTIKPIDREGLAAWARRVPLMVSVEDHNVLGGMGGAVAEVLAELGSGARLHRHGILDAFGESGETDDLYRKFRLDAEGITEVVRAQL